MPTNTITAPVQAIHENETKDGRPYWKVKLKGEEYTTFKEDIVVGLVTGMVIDAEVATEKRGNFTNRYLNSWAEASGVKASAPRADKAEAREVPPPEVYTERDGERARSMALSYAKDLALALEMKGDSEKLSEIVIVVAKRFEKYIKTGQ